MDSFLASTYAQGINQNESMYTDEIDLIEFAKKIAYNTISKDESHTYEMHIFYTNLSPSNEVVSVDTPLIKKTIN